MMRRLFVILTLLGNVCSQSWSTEQDPSLSDIFVNVYQDQRAIVSSPLRMETEDRWVWGLTALSVLVLTPNYQHRQSIGERAATSIEHENVQYNTFFNRLTWLGDESVLFGCATASYGMGAFTEEPRLKEVSAHWLEALINSSIWVTGLKMLAGRNRPGKENPQSRFTGPLGYFRDQGANSSFPSGHTALAFTTAAVFTREADGNLWVGIPAYSIAGGVAFSRVYVEKHWITDVIFGAALGHSIGMLVENRRHKDSDTVWQLSPLLTDDSIGLCWTRRW